MDFFTRTLIRYEDHVRALSPTSAEWVKISNSAEVSSWLLPDCSSLPKITTIQNSSYLFLSTTLSSLAADETGHFYTASSMWPFWLIYFDKTTSKWFVRMQKCKRITIYFQELKAAAILTKLYPHLHPSQLLGTLPFFIAVLFEFLWVYVTFTSRKKDIIKCLRTGLTSCYELNCMPPSIHLLKP